MDKTNIPPYPGRPAEHDLAHSDSVSGVELEESRLNASRQAIRQRLLHASNPDKSDIDSEESRDSINSWSSLFLNTITPTVRKTAGKHPYALLAASALTGGYLAWSRPWRKAVGSVILGVIVRNMVTASLNLGSKNGGRILNRYLKRRPAKKYPGYQKQDHEFTGQAIE